MRIERFEKDKKVWRRIGRFISELEGLEVNRKV